MCPSGIDFVISPHVDTRVIRMAFAGADSVVLDEEGDLHLLATWGSIVLKAPYTFFPEPTT